MNRKFLEDLGLDKETVDKVMAEHGKSVESQKSKVTDLETNLNELKTQLDNRDKDLKVLKEKSAGNDELQEKFVNLEKQYKEDKANFDVKLKEAQLTSAIRLALSGKVHDADLVAGLLQKENIELDADGNVTKGLDEQLKTLQESKSFLFVAEQANQPKGTKPAGLGAEDKTTNLSVGSDFAKQANEQAKSVEIDLWK